MHRRRTQRIQTAISSSLCLFIDKFGVIRVNTQIREKRRTQRFKSSETDEHLIIFLDKNHIKFRRISKWYLFPYRNTFRRHQCRLIISKRIVCNWMQPNFQYYFWNWRFYSAKVLVKYFIPSIGLLFYSSLHWTTI